MEQVNTTIQHKIKPFLIVLIIIAFILLLRTLFTKKTIPEITEDKASGQTKGINSSNQANIDDTSKDTGPTISNWNAMYITEDQYVKLFNTNKQTINGPIEIKTAQNNPLTIKSDELILKITDEGNLELRNRLIVYGQSKFRDTVTLDNDLKLKSDKEIFFGDTGLLDDIIGSRKYTQNNYIDDKETLTKSLDKLDTELKNISTALDTTYLRLDASNDPIVGDLTLQPANSTNAFLINQSNGTNIMNVDTNIGQLVVRTTQSSTMQSDDYVTNGTFDTDSSWDKGYGWTITDGKANYTWDEIHFIPNDIDLNQTITGLVTGETYILSFDVICNDSQLNSVKLGGITVATNLETSGTYTYSITAQTINTLVFYPSPIFNGIIDNVHIYQYANTATIPNFVAQNADESIGLEIRAGGSGLKNILLGIDSGKTIYNGSNNIALGENTLASAIISSYNIALGTDALSTGINSLQNIAIGYGTLKSATQAADNIAIGYNSLTNATEPRNNIAIGSNSASSITTGYNNIGLGTNVFNALTGGYNNIALGFNSMTTSTGAYSNIAIGTNTLVQNSRINNIAIGENAMQNSTTAFDNVLIGYNAGNTITTGTYITGVGFGVLSNANPTQSITAIGTYAAMNSTGSSNVAVGNGAMGNNTTGQYNVMVGDQSGGHPWATKYSTSGNVGIGYRAIGGVRTNGNYNIGIGYQSGYTSLTTGSRNIIIGTEAEIQSATANNQLSVGNLIYGTGLDGTLTTVSTGNIGIGEKAPGARLQVTGGTAATKVSIFKGAASQSANLSEWQNSSGSVLTSVDNLGRIGIGVTPDQALDVSGTIQASNLLGGATTLSTDASGNIIRTPSDARLKEDIEPIKNALSTLTQLQGVSFYWKDKERFGDKQEIGFIAQDVEQVIPQIVSEGTEYKSINYPVVTAILTEAIKDQQQQISTINELLGLENLNGLQASEETSLESTQSTTTTLAGSELLESLKGVLKEFKEFTTALGFEFNEDTNKMTIPVDLEILGETNMNNLLVGLIEINTTENAINTKGIACFNTTTQTYNENIDCGEQTLYLQKNLSGNINFFNDAVIFGPDGSIKANTLTVDNATINKDLKVKRLIIEDSYPGKSTIKSGDTSTKIETNSISEDSLVFVTPKEKMQGQTLIVSEQKENEYFIIKLSEEKELDYDVQLNWWIIN